ncbi:MAG: hypothetical protein RLZZ146_926 [Bacteroidota bacterium]
MVKKSATSDRSKNIDRFQFFNMGAAINFRVIDKQIENNRFTCIEKCTKMAFYRIITLNAHCYITFVQ